MFVSSPTQRLCLKLNSNKDQKDNECIFIKEGLSASAPQLCKGTARELITHLKPGVVKWAAALPEVARKQSHTSIVL